MLRIFILLFLCTLTATAAGYGLGRAVAVRLWHRRLQHLARELHRATVALRLAVAANRPPLLSKESCYGIPDPRRPRS